MRPTRWTRKPRVTKPGKGGWHVSRYGFSYIHPATGDGYSAGWKVFRVIEMRHVQEARRACNRRLRA